MAYVKPNTTDLSLDITVNLIRHKMVFVGDVSVGKTSIINRFVENKFNDNYDVITTNLALSRCRLLLQNSSLQRKNIKTTIMGFSRSREIQIPNSQLHKRSITNICSIRCNQYNTHKIEKESFANIPTWIDFIKNIESSPIILVGNKIDLTDQR